MTFSNKDLSKDIVNNRRVPFAAAFLALYLGASICFGRQLDFSSTIEWNFTTLLKLLFVTVVLFCIALVGFRFVATFRNSNVIYDQKFPLLAKLKNSYIDAGAKTKLITLIILLAPQFICFLIVFPGVFAYDSAYHIMQFLDPATGITAKYSVPYTLFLGLCVKLGKALGSVTAGLAVAMFCQALLSSLVIYWVVIELIEMTHSRVLYCIAVITLGLHPFAVLLRVSACQDVLFGALFLATSLELLKLGRNSVNGTTTNRSCYLMLFVFSVSMMLMRNNGVYAYLVMVVLTLHFVFKNRLWKLLITFVMCVGAYCLISGPIYSLCGVQASSATLMEMSSIPSQQLTRALVEHPDSFTDEELSIYYRAYGNALSGRTVEDVSWYWSQSEISDWAKGRMDQDFVKENLSDYIRLYISIGLKCCDSYVDAFLMNTLGFWYPFKSYPDSRTFHPLINYSDAFSVTCQELDDFSRQSVFPGVNVRLESALDSGVWSRIPLVSIFLKPGFYFLMFVMAVLVAFIKRRKEELFLLTLAFGFIVTLLLSPVCIFRYVYPLVMVTPLLLSVYVSRPISACSKHLRGSAGNLG